MNGPANFGITCFSFLPLRTRYRKDRNLFETDALRRFQTKDLNIAEMAGQDLGANGQLLGGQHIHQDAAGHEPTRKMGKEQGLESLVAGFSKFGIERRVRIDEAP